MAIKIQLFLISLCFSYLARGQDCPIPSGLDRFSLEIKVRPCPKLQNLATSLKQGLDLFESEFGVVAGSFKIKIGTGLSTGYKFEDDTLYFSNSLAIINRGLESSDVQIHELFHILTCRKYPKFCQAIKSNQEDVKAIAESSADYFAYIIHSDKCFGENFYVREKCIRPYESDYDYRLVEEEHAQGMAITNYLVKSKLPLSFLKNYFESDNYKLSNLIPLSDYDDFSINQKAPALSIQSENMQVRPRLGVYSLIVGSSGYLTVEFNEVLKLRYPDAKVALVPSSGPRLFKVKGEGPKFEVTAPDHTAYQKFYLQIKSKNKDLGFKQIYLQSIK